MCRTTPWCTSRCSSSAGFRRDAHPMAILTGMVGALSAFYHDTLDINNAEHRHIACDPPDRQDADPGIDGVQIRPVSR